MLTERGISAEKVVLLQDIDYLKQQLGNPKDFASEDDKGLVKKQKTESSQPRRLMRDPRNQILGGVANGMGAFFGIDALWFRLIFIVLSFASGFGLVLYFVLWFIIPEAKTASDFLQLKGETVTAENIKLFHANATKTLKQLDLRSPLSNLIKILTKLAAVLFVFISIGILIAASFATAYVFSSPVKAVFGNSFTDLLLIFASWLTALSLAGLLLMISFRIWQQKNNWNLGTRRTFVGLIAALIVFGSAGMGLSVYSIDKVSSRWDQQTKHYVILPENQSAPSTIVIKGQSSDRSSLNVRFVQTVSEVKIKQTTYPGRKKHNFVVKNDNGVLSIAKEHNELKDCGLICQSFDYPDELVVYAPQISNLRVSNNATISINNLKSETVNIAADESSTIVMDNGQISKLNATAKNHSRLLLRSLNATEADFSIDEGSLVYAPTSQIMSFTVPCVEDESDKTIVYLDQFPSNQILLNGEELSRVQISKKNCFDVSSTNLYDDSGQGGQDD